MDERLKIMVVDDEELMRKVICSTVQKNWPTLGVASGAECLAAVAQSIPDVILMDVDMPGIDGYETCRRLKQRLAPDVPVIFISARDEIKDKLCGYEAGGEDYITKPFEPADLCGKIANLLETRAVATKLQEQAEYAQRTAMTAMTVMGELGALLQAMQRFNACKDVASLADEILAGIGSYDLSGVVQLRVPEMTVTRSVKGTASPLEISVISGMAEMERIVQFKSRLSITYPHASLLVNNLPVEDEDRCGRLRDHLAMLVESADIHALGLFASEQSNRRGLAIAGAVASTTQALEEVDRAQRESRVAVNIAVQDMTEAIERAYIGLGLTDGQEAMLDQIMRQGIDRILLSQSIGADVGARLTALVAELKKVATQ